MRLSTTLGLVSTLATLACDIADPPSIMEPELATAVVTAPPSPQWRLESITVGGFHACGLEPDGEAYCWGYNGHGELGDGTYRDHRIPAPVVGGLTFTSIEAGGVNTCGLIEDGTAYCWGQDGYKLGDTTATGFTRTVPGAVTGGRAFTSITVGSSHTCALQADGSAYCWGNNANGQLGNPSADLAEAEPIVVSGGHEFVFISATLMKTCAVEGDGDAFCWGWDEPRGVNVTAPTPVPGSIAFTEVSAAPDFSMGHTCGLTGSGDAYCWGGDVPHADPTLVSGGHTFASLSDTGHMCALDTAGALYCWDARLQPTAVAPGYSFMSFSGGFVVNAGTIERGNVCALDREGYAYCWGDNGSGQVGDGTTLFRREPMPVLAPGSPLPPPNKVTDLEVAATTGNSVTLSWTQVDDGMGAPAWYRVKYGSPIGDWDDWSEATIGCDRTLVGDEVGAPMSCTVEGLTPDKLYEFRLMSFRVVDGVWRDAQFSNSVTTRLAVMDLVVLDVSSTSLTVGWTQVDDGTGNPAWYRVKYGSPIDHWRDATVGCDRTLVGNGIGAYMICTIEGLQTGTTYEVQLMSYRVADGQWVDARYSNVATGTPAWVVNDLRVTGETQSTLTVSWTQIDDGTGHPAWYRVKYAPFLISDWANATVGCSRTLVGEEIGAPMSCTIEGLQSSTLYYVQLMSYRVINGRWMDAHYSNLAYGFTAP